MGDTTEPQDGEYWVISLGGRLTVGKCSAVQGIREWETCGQEQYYPEGEAAHWVCLPVRKIELGDMPVDTESKITA